MRPVPARVWVTLAWLVLAAPAMAGSIPLVAASRDGALDELQRKLDRHFGAGRIPAATGFIGAKSGDPDPWFWSNPGRPVVVTILERKSPFARIGWYAEDATAPVLDGIGDEIVLEKALVRDSRSFRVPADVQRFGFYLYQGPHVVRGAMDAGAQFTTYTNRLWNAPGPAGSGAMHAPYDGDIQMLVYDISRWAGPNTWLVACESSDSGARVGHGPDDTDNDYSDFLFTVTGAGVTPTIGTTFGQLKSRFR